MVKTFKRTGNIVTSNLSVPNRTTTIGLKSPHRFADNQTAKSGHDPNKPKASQSNKKRLRKLLGFHPKPQRLDSEISTGTNSTYLSYSSYSSTSSPSPRNIYKDRNNLNFNFYDEQEELLNNTNTSYGFSSVKPSRSNSNSTHSTNSSELLPSCHTYDSHRCSSIYKNQRSANQTSGKLFIEAVLSIHNRRL